MINFLKQFYRDIKDETGRFNILSSVIRNFPGQAGFLLRNSYIPQFFSEFGECVKIHEGVRFRGAHKIKVGNNVVIGVDNFIQASGGIVLGDHVILGPGVKIWTANHKFDDIDKPILQQGYDYEEVNIGNNVWLGANVFIMPGVTLPEGCVVSAGSVVGKKKYPPYSLLVGNPCRVVGSRKK